jgi:hypothetical protein
VFSGLPGHEKVELESVRFEKNSQHPTCRMTVDSNQWSRPAARPRCFFCPGGWSFLSGFNFSAIHYDLTPPAKQFMDRGLSPLQVTD